MLKPRKKITRKELKHDPLMETLYRIRHWWLDHQSQISRYGSITLVVLVLSVLVIRWRNTQDTKAAAVAGMAFIEFGQGNYQAVIDQLSGQTEEFRGLKSFGNGLFLLARSELYVGDSLNAEKHYLQYLDDYSDDPLITAGSMAGLGVIAEGRGEYPSAAEWFRKASRKAPTATIKQQYAVFAGRNFLLAGLPEETLEVLEPLLAGSGSLDFQTTSEVQSLVAAAEARRKNG